MNEKHCWYDLDIDVKNCFKPEFKFPTPKGRYGIWDKLAWDVFNMDWLKYVSAKGLPVYSVIIFYRGPYASTLGAHVDISTVEPFLLTNFAINWVYGGRDSTMSWYDTPLAEKKIEYTPAGTAYKVWNKRELNKIESDVIGESVKLVRTGIPHSIEMGSDPRWCISARTSIHHDYEWDHVVGMMRNQKLLVERDV